MQAAEMEDCPGQKVGEAGGSQREQPGSTGRGAGERGGHQNPEAGSLDWQGGEPSNMTFGGTN